MTATTRKLFVVGFVTAILLMANAGVITGWLQNVGVIPWAQQLREIYLPGSTLTVIAVLLVLLPSGAAVAVCVRRCRVCDGLLLRRGKYCGECGSRV